MLKQEIKTAILKLQTLYPEKRSALIPALHMAQKQMGYLPLEIQQDVAKLFNIDLNEVHAVVTFYDMFHEKPVGKHLIHVCKNVSCMLHGADELLENLCQKLSVKAGDISPDGEFTIIPSECLGACDRAPMMIVDETVVGPAGENDIDQILQNAKKTAGHCAHTDEQEITHG